jgi:hypothetical protein
LGRRMPEDVVREELGALGICAQGIMQLRSGRRVRDPEKDRPATPHFIVTVARGPEVTKIRSMTQLCGLRVTAETYTALKGPLQCKRCQRFGTPSVTAVTRPVVWRVERLTIQVSAPPQRTA